MNNRTLMANNNYPSNWATLKRIVLTRDAHTCHLCGEHATTVDHLTSIDQARQLGWTDQEIHDLQNLAAACTACNYSKGGKEGRQKQLAHQKAKRGVVEAKGGVFLGAVPLPPVGRRNPPRDGQFGQTASSSELEPGFGSVVARVHSPLLEGSSLVDDLVAWALENVDESFFKAPGMPLLPWQEWWLRDALAVDDQGEFRRKTVLGIVARQNGKTHAVRMVMAYLMATRPGFNIVGMAQKLLLAKQTWEQTCEIFEFSPKLKPLIHGKRLTNGEQMIQLTNRSRYSVLAATRRARGFTANMVYIDELREVNLEAWESVQPFLKTTQGQLWTTSNAGDVTSEALNELRASIMAYPDERRALYEWSAPEKAAVGDRAGWAMANPSLGWLFDESAIEDSLATMSPGGFRTETLCQFVTALNPAIPIPDYEECAGEPLVEPGAAQCWFAIDATPDSKRADLLVAIEGERITLAPLRSWTHAGAIDDQAIADEIAALAQVWRPRLIGYNAYAVKGIGDRLTKLGHPMKNITGAEFGQACDQLLSAVVHKRLVHPGDPTMLQHFAHSVAKPLADGGWRLYRRESGGYISMACAAAMAISLASVPRTSPMIMAV